MSRFLRLEVGPGLHYARWVDDLTARLWSGPPWAGGEETGHSVALADATVVVPIEPTKIVCVGRNYRLHAEELGNEVPAEPLLFLKPPSSLLGPAAAIELPRASSQVEHEGELGVVVGRRLRRSSASESLKGVFGLTCVNDVTARDLQRRDVQFTRGKGFDTFCPVGPEIVVADPEEERQIEVRVNGDLRQGGATTQMEVPVGELLSYVSWIMTLEPGDLVATGTPAGVGPLNDGDVVTVEIEGIGRLVNPVAKAPR